MEVRLTGWHGSNGVLIIILYWCLVYVLTSFKTCQTFTYALDARWLFLLVVFNYIAYIMELYIRLNELNKYKLWIYFSFLENCFIYSRVKCKLWTLKGSCNRIQRKHCTLKHRKFKLLFKCSFSEKLFKLFRNSFFIRSFFIIFLSNILNVTFWPLICKGSFTQRLLDTFF